MGTSIGNFISTTNKKHKAKQSETSNWMDNLLARYSSKGIEDGIPDSRVWEDLSGNGNSARLYGFLGNADSGFYKEELVFDGIDDYVAIFNIDIKDEYTIIMSRNVANEPFTALLTGTNESNKFIISIEDILPTYQSSVNYGKRNPINIRNGNIIFQTSKLYNAQDIEKGDIINDSPIRFIIGFGGKPSKGIVKDLLIFNKDLSVNQILEIINYYNIS